MKRQIKYLFFILVLFSSCAKEGKNIYIEGKVVNPVTGEGIEGIRLVLHKEVIDFGSGSSSKIKQTAYSDANGNFVLKHNGSLVNKFIVLIEFPDGTPGYHLVGWKDEAGNTVGGYQLPVKKGSLMKVNLELVPYAFFKVNANNNNCFNTLDSMFLYKQNQIGSLQIGPWIYPGCNSFSGGYNKVPMGTIYFSWDVKRNGSIQSFSDTIFLNENEYRTYTIDY